MLTALRYFGKSPTPLSCFFKKNPNTFIDMKEIKFRAWDQFEKEMIYYKPGDAINFGLMPAQGLIPMQFTGLKDKNGREIYEGDIVKCPVIVNRHIFGNFSNRVVKWKADSFTYVFDSDFSWIRFEDSVSGDGDYIEYTDEGVVMKIEVIGNIYENNEKIQDNTTE